MSPLTRSPLREYEHFTLLSDLRHYDTRLQKHREFIEKYEWAAETVFDDYEHVVGMACVACQHYIGMRCAESGVCKRSALDLPPKHKTGIPIVSIINAAANYWKHHSEWPKEDESGKWDVGSMRGTQKKAAVVLNDVHCLRAGFPCICALEAITGAEDTPVTELLKYLNDWSLQLECTTPREHLPQQRTPNHPLHGTHGAARP